MIEELEKLIKQLEKDGDVDPDTRIEAFDLSVEAEDEFAELIGKLRDRLEALPDKEPEDLGEPFVSPEVKEIQDRLDKIEGKKSADKLKIEVE